MIKRNLGYQRGVTLTGLLLAGVVIGLVAVLGMKVAPDVIQYLKILNNMKAVAADGSLQGASVAEVRKAFDRRSIVDHIEDFSSQDIEVTKVGGRLVLATSYTRRIALVGPVSLLIDFEASTAK